MATDCRAATRLPAHWHSFGLFFEGSDSVVVCQAMLPKSFCISERMTLEKIERVAMIGKVFDKHGPIGEVAAEQA